MKLNDEIGCPLTRITKFSAESGVIPGEWKSANVAPIRKSGARQQSSNYRLISLTSQICKVVMLVLVIQDVMMQHIEFDAVTTGTRHGFHTRGSCLAV